MDRKDDEDGRNVILALLEEAARYLEMVGRNISAGDRPSAFWKREAYGRRVQGLRELKMAVMLPKVDTRDWLEKELQRLLTLVAVGNWDGLPVNKFDLPRSLAWWRRALFIVRSGAIAFVPIIAISTFGPFKSLPADISRYVNAGCWVWALLNVIWIVDPRAAEKLSAAKDLSSLLSGGSKSKE